ncbi:unnamed protein product [Protopolystoma xenopodis]|uniref:Uncharacterized protein n=1 Tax=Protopolystoma xenopodis TaxID=117903 RepID=A0A3S5A7T0_9PLAT|nr:unnamed protein product [Protopolystoma xenopodis]
MPFIVINSWLPIVEPRSGNCQGNLRVRLAVGNQAQFDQLSRCDDVNYLALATSQTNLLTREAQKITNIGETEIDAYLEAPVVEGQNKMEPTMDWRPLDLIVWSPNRKGREALQNQGLWQAKSELNW